MELSYLPILEEWLLTLEVAGRSAKTLSLYRHYLTRLLQHLSERERALDDRQAIHRWLATLASTSPGAARVAYGAAHAWYRWCVAEGIVDRNPLDGVPMPKAHERVAQSLSPDEIRRLLAACDRGPIGVRDQAIILVLYDTGLRASELLQMTVDPAGRYEYVDVVGKGGRERVVLLGARARQAVLRYVRVWRPPGPPLWLARDRTPLEYPGLREITVRLSQRTGIRFRPHALRHSFAQAMLARMEDWDAVRVLGGWRSSTVMQRYLRGREWERAIAVKRRHSPADAL